MIMSRFISERYASLKPYVPGEQPRGRGYVKLNTNESPFPPCEAVCKAAAEAARSIHLYSDPDNTALREKLAEVYKVGAENVIAVNGSDDVLNFAFAAFCSKSRPAAFADITYGFYKVFAEANGVPYRIVPLRDDLSLDADDYIGGKETVFIANPNAPTGIALPLSEVERIAASDSDRVVVIDEAYVDFGGESAVPLTAKYANLLVVGTFSKSRSLAGGRLGFAFGSTELINDLNTVRCTVNPYNVNRMTAAAGIASLENGDITRENCRIIAENREYVSAKLAGLGFTLTPSATNFVFAKHRCVPGETLYKKLKEKGVLVRHFNAPRIAEYNRITVGTREQMDILITKITEILEEENALD